MNNDPKIPDPADKLLDALGMDEVIAEAMQSDKPAAAAEHIASQLQKRLGDALAAPAIKVFVMNDCEWAAGACSPEEMLAWYMEQTGLTREEATGEEDGPPEELSPEAMERLTFHCEDGSRHSFAEELRLMIERGDRFPCFFASTEY